MTPAAEIAGAVGAVATLAVTLFKVIPMLRVRFLKNRLRRQRKRTRRQRQQNRKK